MGTVQNTVVLALLTLSVGCVRAGFDPGLGVLTDGGADVVDPTQPFNAPTKIAALNTSDSEEEPTLPADELEIYFERNDDIWVASRTSASGSWSDPKRVAELNTSAAEEMPTISADGLTIFFSSTRKHPQALGNEDIFVATRSQRWGQWGNIAPVENVNSSAADRAGSVSPDLMTIVYMSKRSGSAELYLAQRDAPTDPWSPPSLLPRTAPHTGDRSPWLGAAGTVLYFDSARPGGKGTQDIWVATRGDTSASFGAPVPVTSLNSGGKEERPWLSLDMKTIYFSSGGEIVVARR